MKVNLLNHRLGSPKKDLLAVTLVSCAVFLIAIRSRLFALFLRTQQRQPLMIDEGSFLLLLLLLAVAVFALRRWSELRKERARRQKAEQAADTREQAFNQIVEQADEMIYRTDARGHFVLCSPSVSRILEYSDAEIRGKHYLEIIKPEQRKAVSCFYKKQLTVRERSTYYEFTALAKSGRELLLGQSVQLITENDQIVGFQAVAQDLTVRKQAEEAARDIQEYRNLFKLANDPILILNFAGTVLDVNDKACETYGVAREQFIGRPLHQFAENGESDGERLQGLLAEGRFEEFETVQLRSDGTQLHFLINPTLIQYHGEPAILSINRDITIRKQIEKEHQRLQAERDELLEQLQLQIEVMPLAFILCDASYQTTYWNPAAERIFGYTKQEIIGGSSHKLLVPPESQNFVESLFDRIASGESLSSSFSDNITKDGRRITCEWYTAPLKKHDGTFLGIMSMAQDVTELRRIEVERQSKEEQLRQAQKMEAVGHLAGGIAHDFNNLLTAINGYSDLALKRLDETNPLRNHLEQIKKAGLRAANLTQQLLAFSRKQVLQSKTLDLNEVVREIDAMLQRLIGEDIDLVTLPARELGQVKADPGQIEQLLLNLVVNARDAMPRGGKITIETENIYLDGTYSEKHHAVPPGPYVRLSVSDTGVGMDSETQKMIFEPFFTTKPTGKGTGLGLSTVYGIVKQSGGHIWVYSELGKGTTFKVYLPRINDATERIEEKEQLLLSGAGTILLVEDEEMVRDLSKAILEDHGYDVMVAANGVQGLQICKDFDKRIDLLITDVVMPEMSGRELAEQAGRLRQNMKILYMSGYTDDAVVRHGILEEHMAFIQKPFLPDSLATKVRDILLHDHESTLV